MVEPAASGPAEVGGGNADEGHLGPAGEPGAYSVVVTRSVEDNRSLVAALGRLGVSTVELPLVEVSAPPDGGRALSEAVARLEDYRWVVLTSVNGVTAVATAMADRRWPDDVTVAPVGPTTAAAARAAGMIVAEPPSQATAETLVEEFEPWDGVAGRRVLAPLAELAGRTVVDGLTAKGYLVDRLDAYRTAAPTGADRDSDTEDPARRVAGADAVAFFSPSVVDRFLDRCGLDGIPATAICIGPSTAARAAAGGFSTVITAEPHTEAGVVAVVARLAAAR